MKTDYSELWDKLHTNFGANHKYNEDSWLKEFDDIIEATDKQIIDLGCGVTGFNTKYLLNKNKDVLSTDFSDVALTAVKKIKNSKTIKFNLLDKFPIQSSSTDLVICDITLHYFSYKDTSKIIGEINRILTKGGHLLFRVNSTNTSECINLKNNKEESIEENFYNVKSIEKRFFDEESLKEFFKDWEIITLREENISRWEENKIIWLGLVRKI